jgi:LysR family transcriptional regulator, glycine cleavage system transcriptional activator
MWRFASGPGTTPGWRSEKILDEYLVAVASPAVLAKYRPLPDAAALARVPLLHGTEIDSGSWCAGDTDSLTRLRGAFIDDSAALLSAAIEGLGFGILRWTLAAGELQAGRVVLASTQVMRYRFAYHFSVSRGLYGAPEGRSAAGLVGATGAAVRCPTYARGDGLAVQFWRT